MHCVDSDGRGALGPACGGGSRGRGTENPLQRHGFNLERGLPGVELRLFAAGKAKLMLGGQSTRPMEQRLGIGRLGAVMIAGGLAAAAVMVGSMSDNGAKRLNKNQCLLPGKELCS